MRFLRTASTRRLLAVIAGLVAVIAATAAIAAAASGTGPVPRARPLAAAVHHALSGPKITGITADIRFTNNLIDASAIQGSDPILTGASGRLWLGDHRMRLELQSNNGDVELVLDHSHFWISDPATNTVYQGTLPTGLMGGSGAADKAQTPADNGIPSIAQIQKTLAKLMQHVNLSGATPGDVAGQPTYTVSVSPQHDGGLLGSAEVAFDAIRGVPLRLAVYARGNPTPVLELVANHITYGAVPAADFNVAPPVGAKVVKVATGTTTSGTKAARAPDGHGHHASVTGISAVSSKLSFPLVAPSSLVGLPRHTVTLLDWGGSPAALVTYGQGLGGVAVIEKASSATSSAASRSASKSSQSQGDSGHSGLSLPTVSINGATGTELDTALGTLVRFTRSGVAYTV
ncbi:MAG: hypothetical protein M3022_10970, partial [Actinomycetota bacterium]|nr:hypothetical protein [Actinomycetota bacterium]